MLPSQVDAYKYVQTRLRVHDMRDVVNHSSCLGAELCLHQSLTHFAYSLEKNEVMQQTHSNQQA